MDLPLTIAVLIPTAWIFCAVSIAFTLAHTLEEVRGAGGPFWDYYRRHFGHGLEELVGWPFSELVGRALFASLAAILIGLAVGGYLFGSAFLLGGLLGARVGDAVLSHIGLRDALPGPNPGLLTSPLYLVEATVVVFSSLAASPHGFAIGWCAFAAFWTVSFLTRKR